LGLIRLDLVSSFFGNLHVPNVVANLLGVRNSQSDSVATDGDRYRMNIFIILSCLLIFSFSAQDSSQNLQHRLNNNSEPFGHGTFPHLVYLFYLVVLQCRSVAGMRKHFLMAATITNLNNGAFGTACRAATDAFDVC
jgi:hypothetical protein